MSDRKEKSTRFGRKMSVAVSAVLTAPTLEAAAQLVGIPASTLRRWRGRPEFARQLALVQGEILQGVVNSLRSAGLDAAQTLRQVASDPKAPTPARVRASGMILTLLLRNHEHEALEFRMSQIESALKYGRSEREQLTGKGIGSRGAAGGRRD
jgi:hypothetical protein